MPVAIAVVHGPPDSRAPLAVGAGAASTVGEAWLKAVAEGFGVYRWLRQQTIAHPDRERPEPDSIESFDEHMLFYAAPSRPGSPRSWTRPPSDGRRGTVTPLEGAGPRSQIEALVERLERHGVSPYAADVTAPDVASLGLQRGARRRSRALRSRRLPARPLPRRHPPVHRRVRGRFRPGTARAPRSEPAPAPLPVSDVTDSTIRADPVAEEPPVATIRLAGVIGADCCPARTRPRTTTRPRGCIRA